MNKLLAVGLFTCGLALTVGASEVQDEIQSTCRWIDSEEIFPTTTLRQVAALDGDAENLPEGVTAGCATVLSCMLEARTGTRDDRNLEPPDSSSVDASPLCWRVADIEQLRQEAIDRMAGHLDGADQNAAACGRFLQCLSRSDLGAVEDRAWREEFARICSMTNIADTLSREELQALIDDSEALLSVLEALSAPDAKIYVFRTKMCRDLFIYSLQILESQVPAAADEETPE